MSIKLYCGECDESFEPHEGTVIERDGQVLAICPWCDGEERLLTLRNK